ncbi:hypothetical protein KAR91_65375 [Candidatus Pacearchaeota archaeon]|nr:hypothetical protein [Candidatus Pacearchaeota archaeon]
MKRSYIGISGDCEHNSSVALIEYGKIIYSEQEERLSGLKGDGHFPYLALKKAIKLAKYEVVYCIVGNHITPNKAETRLDVLTKSRPKNLWKYGIANLIRGGNRIEFVEHHTAHMSAGLLFSGFEKALVVTADGQGDGLSLTISNVNREITRIFENPCDWGSPGFLYAAITRFVGYKPLSGEGKLTALAASGKSQTKLDLLFSEIFYSNEEGFLFVNSDYINNYSRKGSLWTRKFSEVAEIFESADIALALQKRFEYILTSLIDSWLHKKGKHNLVVTGGVFANVSLNRKIQELDTVKIFFVTPYMGDEGTSLGSAAWIYYLDSGQKPEKIKTMFLGSCCNYTQNNNSLVEVISENVEKHIAELLSKDEVVARIFGKMEFGPRALGNHSILYQPNNPLTISWLNKKLGRSEVMPFAPAIIEEHADKYLKLCKNSNLNYEYMTTSFRVTSLMKSTCTGVVHKDLTVRPQVVKYSSNPSFHKIINEYYKITGTPVVLNTSFNYHGFPIILKPDDAIATCKKAKINYLQINNKLFRVNQ